MPIVIFPNRDRCRGGGNAAGLASSGGGALSRPAFKLINRSNDATSDVMTITGHTSGVASCCYSPNGRYIASASEKLKETEVDVLNGAQAIVLRDTRGPVSYSRDGRWLFTSNPLDAGEPGD